MIVVGFAETVHRVKHVEGFYELPLGCVGKADNIKTRDVVVFLTDVLVACICQIGIGAQNFK